VELNESLHGQLLAGHVRTSLDPRANAIVVERASDLTSSTEDLIETEAEESPVDVEIDPQPERTLHGSLTACHFEPNPKGCDLPVRGGLPIDFEGGLSETCTAGFPAVGNIFGNKFMLTAGHCLQGTGSLTWRTFDSVQKRHPVGQTEKWAFNGAGGYNDYGAININSGWWAEGAWKQQIVLWGTSQEYPIESEAWSFVGQVVCNIGKNYGRQCGTVSQVDVTYTDPAPTLIEHTNVFGPSCIDNGDSGSPVFNWGGHAALGLVSADNSWNDVPAPCERYTYYTEITRDTDLLGVKVASVREGGSPSATTGGASGVQPHQATVSGVVNPNMVQTRYEFEYGPGTGYGSVMPVPAGEAGHGSGGVGVNVTLPGLQSGTTYNYRLKATSAAGTSYGANATLTTPFPPPVAKTGAPKEGTETGATLTGSVQQPETETATTYWFKYGKTTAYGSETAKTSVAANSTPKTVTTVLSGLEPGATYHYRLVASNPWGASEGPDELFTAAWGAKPLPSEGAFRIEGTSCGAPTMCAAVGSQGTSVRARIWDGTKWTLTSPLNPAGALEAVLRDVSCPSASFCMGVGHYKNSAGEFKTLAEKYNGTSWELTAPPNPGGTGGASFLTGVSCSTASSCAAVGYHHVAGGIDKAFGTNWSSTSWSASQLVAEESGSQGTYLRGVYCSSSQECRAVGYQLSKSSEWRPVFAYWFGSNWSTSTWPEMVPAGAKGTWLEAVSCAQGNCASAGSYVDAAGVRQPLIYRGNTIQTTLAPEGATLSELYGVSCSTPTSCMAVGQYTVPGRGSRSLAYAFNGSNTWSPQYPLNPLDQAAGDTTLNLLGVSCPRDGRCLAVGSYQGGPGLTPHADEFARKVPPTSTSTTASGVTDSGAQLRGKVNPNGQSTTYYFEYGTTTAYGTTTSVGEAGAGEVPLEFSQAISGLSSGTSYQYRIVATNASGTTVGENSTFKTPRKWRLQSAPSPSEGKPTRFGGVSCPSTATCFAVGDIEPTVENPQMLAERWNGTSWAVQSLSPTLGSIEGISCPTASDCTAVGYTLNVSKVKTAGILRWNGTAWQLLAAPPLPVGAKSSVLREVSCITNGQCTAVGSYESSAGQRLPLIERWSGSAWTLQSAQLPVGATLAELTGVSCLYWTVAGLSQNECMAAGYAEKSGIKESLTERWAGGGWEIKSVPAPVGAKATQLSAVACFSQLMLECLTGGPYTPSSGPNALFTARWNSSSWQSISTPSSLSELAGISCISFNSCEAAAGFSKVGTPTAIALQWAESGWLVQLTPTPEGAKGTWFNGISCDPVGNCTAAGQYEDASGVKRLLVLRFS
jgi:hypothetical protein